MGGLPVERSGATQQVPWTHLCARTVVLLHFAHQEALNYIGPGLASLPPLSVSVLIHTDFNWSGL